MIPRTFPSTVSTENGKTQMVIAILSDVTGLQRWKDYIPVKEPLSVGSINTYNNTGAIQVEEIASLSGKQAWKDYIPVYVDESATAAWTVSALGYIPATPLLFNPLTLFAAGEQGAWYDPSDSTTLFQDAAGTTPVTAVEQPVSLMLDKSKSLTTAVVVVTNGDFATDSDWTKGTGWTIGSGVATKTAGTAANLTQTILTTAGQWYKVTATITRTAGGITTSIGTSGTTSGSITTGGTYTWTILAGSSTQSLTFAGDASFAGTVDNVSVQSIAGNHAYTPSTATASRPVLSARKNLLVNTETLATQTRSVRAVEHILSFYGTGTVTLSGVSTAGPLVGTGANDRVYLAFTPTAGNLTLTVSGTVTKAQLEETRESL
jgi:hypothetical protein